MRSTASFNQALDCVEVVTGPDGVHRLNAKRSEPTAHGVAGRVVEVAMLVSTQ